MACKEVLFVDDDAELRQIFADLCHGQGYEAITFANGHDALTHLNGDAEDVGLVILDLDMPVMDGFAFLDARAKSPALSSVPVVVLSGSMRGQRLDGFEIAAALEKPISADALLDTIRRFCGTPIPRWTSRGPPKPR
jgi:CheY-like chemotaxis protein